MKQCSVSASSDTQAHMQCQLLNTQHEPRMRQCSLNLRHQSGRYFTGSLTPSGLWVASETLPALADSCTELVEQHPKYSLSTSTEHQKNFRVELVHNSEL